MIGGVCIEEYDALTGFDKDLLMLVAADCNRVQNELWGASCFHFWDIAKRPVSSSVMVSCSDSM